MSDDGSKALINLGDLSKPVNTLIEKVGVATGVWFEPHRIRRKAKAKADAKILTVQAEIQADELQRRALYRLAAEEAKKQENIENVMEGAFDQVTDDAKPEAVDEDWISNFIDKVKTVSNKDVQKKWSKILAGEANNPGSFSKRSINVLHEIDTKDANLFTELCRYIWHIGTLAPLIFDETDAMYTRNAVNFVNLNHLHALGLIRFEGLSGFSRTNFPQRIEISYCGKLLKLDFGDEGPRELAIGRVMLTQVGQELFTVVYAPAVDGFYDYVADRWKQWVVT